MQRFETRAGKQVPSGDLGLDLSPPVRLDPWALLFAFGIVAYTVAPPLAVALVCAGAVLSLVSVLQPGLVPDEWRIMVLISPLFVAGGVGVAVLHASVPDPLREFAAVEPGEVVVVGRVHSAPVPTSYGYRADLRVEHLWYEEREVLRGGGLQVYSFDLPFGVGDRVRVDGELSLPEVGDDGFDYGRYLETKNVSGLLYATGAWPVDEERGMVGRIHRRTQVSLGYGLRPREGSVVRGMVLGDQSRIPEELQEAFRRSGITHVLAISGQHVAVLAAMIYVVLRLLAVPMFLRNPATLALAWLYILVAGAPPSAIRAGVVATFVLVAPLLGRQLSALHFMTTMLAVVLAWNPLLIFNPGFQLSVAAVFGILLLRKPLLMLVKGTVLRPFGGPPELLANLLAVSLAAQVATMPIIGLSFGEVSAIGPLTNLVAVPLSGPILTLGLLGALAGGVATPLAYLVNSCNGFLVTVLAKVAEAASTLPVAAVETPGATLWLVGLFYLGCVPAAISGWAFPEERWPRLAALLLVWAAAWTTLVAVL